MLSGWSRLPERSCSADSASARLSTPKRSPPVGQARSAMSLSLPLPDANGYSTGTVVTMDGGSAEAARPARGSARASLVRELMPSLAKTLRRWYSTVWLLMKSCAPISAFERPSRARRAICASWAVRSPSSRRCVCGRARRSLPTRRVRARRRLPSRSRRRGRAPSAIACVHQGVGVHVSTTRRRGDERARSALIRVLPSRSIAYT